MHFSHARFVKIFIWSHKMVVSRRVNALLDISSCKGCLAQCQGCQWPRCCFPSLLSRAQCFSLQVFTWGHKMVMPRRVNVARDTRKAGPAPLKFHRAERLHVVAIAAGGVHSTLISQEGLVFYWESPDVQLRCRQVRLAQGV